MHGEEPVVRVGRATKRRPAGVISSSRITVAAAPPTKKKNVIEAMYNRPIRLWSVVKSHDLSV